MIKNAPCGETLFTKKARMAPFEESHQTRRLAPLEKRSTRGDGGADQPTAYNSLDSRKAHALCEMELKNKMKTGKEHSKHTSLCVWHKEEWGRGVVGSFRIYPSTCNNPTYQLQSSITEPWISLNKAEILSERMDRKITCF